jgi:hypothetical protein
MSPNEQHGSLRGIHQRETSLVPRPLVLTVTRRMVFSLLIARQVQPCCRPKDGLVYFV